MDEELTPKLDKSGNPVLDDSGKPIMEKKSDTNVQQPKLDADGNPVLDESGTPVLETKPEFNQEQAPEWLNVEKYGKPGMTIAEIKEAQAKAYHEAEKEMHKAINESNLTKKEITSMKATLESLKAGLNVQPKFDINNISDEFREQVLSQFGDTKTAEQVIADQMLLDGNLAPIREFVLEGKWDRVEAKLEKDPLCIQFPELLERVRSLPLTDRINPEKIKEIKSEFLNEKLPEIIAAAKLEGAKSVTVVTKPASSQTPERGSNENPLPANSTPANKERKGFLVFAE